MRILLKIRGVIAALVFPCILQCSGGGDEVLTDGSATGHLYCYNGIAASGAIIEAVPFESVPIRISLDDSSSGFTQGGIFAHTDSEGKYQFPSLLRGVYNIYCRQDSMHAMLEQVLIQGEVTLRDDTLKAPGGIDGIVQLAGSGNYMTILIMVIGSDASTDPNMFTLPSDSTGHFTFKNLPEGKHRIRFMSTYRLYPVFDTTFSVISGKITDVGTIILKESK